MDFKELRPFKIFDDFSDQELESFSSTVEKLRLEPESRVFNDGDPGDAMYLLAHGEVRVHKVLGQGEEKTDKTLAILPAGVFFGEMAIIDNAPRSANITTVKPTILYKISKPAVDRLLCEEPVPAFKLIMFFLRQANDRLRATNNELVALYEVGKIIGDPGNISGLVKRVLKVLMDSVKPDRGFVMLHNDISNVIEVVEAQGPQAAGFLGKKYRPGAGIAGAAIALKKPQRYDDLESMEKPPPLAGFEGAAVMAAPLFFQARSFGALTLCSDKPDSFTNANFNLLLGVASMAGSAIQNAREQMDKQAKDRLTRKMIRF